MKKYIPKDFNELSICENKSPQIKKIENIFSERKRDWEAEFDKLYCKGAMIDDKFIRMTYLEYHYYVALQNHLQRQPTIKDFKKCTLQYVQMGGNYFIYKKTRLLQFEEKIIENFENNKFSYQIKTNVKFLT